MTKNRLVGKVALITGAPKGYIGIEERNLLLILQAIMLYANNFKNWFLPASGSH